MAGATALASGLFYFLRPKNEHFIEPLVVYLFFVATVGLLIVQSGGVASAFIMLWLLVAFFGAIFAVYGWLPVFIATGIFLASEYLSGRFDPNGLAVVAVSSVLPTVIGIIIWRSKGVSTEAEKSVQNLASELSEVANRSEIVINAIGDGVVAIDAQGIIQLINPAAQEILGWGKQDAMMLNYKSILQMTDLNNVPLDPALVTPALALASRPPASPPTTGTEPPAPPVPLPWAPGACAPAA